VYVPAFQRHDACLGDGSLDRGLLTPVRLCATAGFLHV